MLPKRSEKPLHWVGSSRKDLVALPADAVDDFGYALSAMQMDATSPQAKPWKGEGSGVLELVENDSGNTFRAVYTVRFAKAVYVLHCFQKKSPSGSRTSQNDIVLIHTRLKLAQQHYKEHHEHQS
ncbi:type II toxin-antitoxin system RelE/ParE family toxin [Polaromonas glacialis]|uniref:type II toxin-antitoxin system RelE/ParE family toxin n=1 Tax=Polaromonas glacialis TaxID=866564 RepID=UPI0004957E63|nr:type II toxin-antitoxin system RelE/ParE family toxin [Polaromonas glacialis]